MINKDKDVIKQLLREKTDHSINSLAKKLKMDYKNAHNIVKRLEKQEIITLQPFGRSLKIILKKKCSSLVYAAEHERAQELLKNKDLALMLDYYERNMKSKFYILLIFGSYAKGTSTKGSDIDMVFIVPDASAEQQEREIQRIAAMLPLDIHLNIFSESEFRAMKDSKKDTAGSEAIKSNIIAYGIEEYYRLLQ